jgi:hypothetical protein
VASETTQKITEEVGAKRGGPILGDNITPNWSLAPGHDMAKVRG